jgi:hypothetical protein
MASKGNDEANDLMDLATKIMATRGNDEANGLIALAIKIMAARGNDEANDVVDLAIKDAKKAKITEIVLSNLGHSPRPYLDDGHWSQLDKKITEMSHLKRTRKSKPHRNNLWVYLTSAEWMNWYHTFFQAVIGVASIGAGFTFSVIVSPLQDPSNSDGKPDEQKLNYIQLCLSISWLLFVFSLAWASLAALIISMNKTKVMEIFDRAKWDTTYREDNRDTTYREDNRDTTYREDNQDSTYREDNGDSTYREDNRDSTYREDNRDSTYREDDRDSTYREDKLLTVALATATLIAILLPMMAFGASAEAVRAYQCRTGLAAIVLLALVAFVSIVLLLALHS